MRIPAGRWRGHRLNLVLATSALTVLFAWTIYHLAVTARAVLGIGHPLATIWLVALILLWWVPLAWMERPHRTTATQQRALDALVVVVQIPVYNEDESALRNCVESVFAQPRRVNRIRVVDDGSHDATSGRDITYPKTQAWFMAEAAEYGIEATWDRTENRGKRRAQMEVLADDPAGIFITLDSDSLLDARAVEEGLKPFADPTVMSVAGCVLVLNARTNALTRLICMLYTPFTRGFRSAQSVLGSVMVNSGTLAFYRGQSVRSRAHSYPRETVAGRPMQMNDDSMLTLYAMFDGRTVHQPTAMCYTLVPETWPHYRNQTIRWMRGTFVRTLWWIRYFSPLSFRFWMPIIEMSQLLLAIVILSALGYLIATTPDAGVLLLQAALVTLVMNYLIGLRYFMVARDDESFAFQLGIYALAPIAAIWRTLLLRPMQYYAMATCWKVGRWGTRDSVEVGMTSST